MTVTSNDSISPDSLDAFEAIELGERPSRAHAYVFIAERDERRCALFVGRELRDDWDDLGEDDTPEAVRLLAGADELFLPLSDDTSAERTQRFRRGFSQLMSQSQRELQEGAKRRTGQAPSLTLTLAYIDGGRLYVGHVGDDRCYLFRRNTLQRLTEDHTVSPPASDRPLLSDPMLSRKLVNVVGGFSDDLKSETLVVNLEPQDIVLLCTPGVTRSVSERTIQEVLEAASGDRSMSLEAVADALLRAVPEHQKSTDHAVALARIGAYREE